MQDRIQSIIGYSSKNIKGSEGHNQSVIVGQNSICEEYEDAEGGSNKADREPAQPLIQLKHIGQMQARPQVRMSKHGA